MSRSGSMHLPYLPVAALLARYRQHTPDKPALVDADSGVTVDFLQLADAVDALARQMQRRGVGPGKRVLLAGDGSPEKLMLWLAIWRLRAVVCPLDLDTLPVATADRLLGLLRPAFIVFPANANADTPVPTGHAPLLLYDAWGCPASERSDALHFSDEGSEPLPDGADLHDLAVMCCTSGTSGMPKVVVYDHASYWLNGLDSTAMLGLTSEDRLLEYRSFGWFSAQILSLMPFLQLGATLTVAPRFSRRRFAGWIRDHRITVCAGVPAVLNILLEAPVDFDDSTFATLRLMTSSSAPLSPVQHERFEARYGITVLNLYGSSEAGWLCGNRLQRRRLGSVGYPAPYARFDIVDADGCSCGPGQEGEVVAHGDKLALALLRADGSFMPVRGAPLRTRDLAVRDEDGFVRVSGRMDELIIRGGVKISPAELEEVMLAHPAVQEAVALGVPHAIYSQEPVCFVTLRQGVPASSIELLAHARERLPRAKSPQRIFVIEAIPRNARGKILRDALRAHWWSVEHGGPA
jgi:acyl-coenzyme A synthetase/AMP-(fatty) acid ligase